MYYLPQRLIHVLGHCDVTAHVNVSLFVYNVLVHGVGHSIH